MRHHSLAAFAAIVLFAARPSASAQPSSLSAQPLSVQTESNIVDLVAKLLPQVVNITITGGPKREFGSGFVIDPSGLILTNRHTIDVGNTYLVTLDDHTQLRATLTYRALGIDLALLQVHAGRPLPAVRWGDSDTMRPGAPVLAIGNPLGLGSTVTTGIISALNRDIKETPIDSFIQIDAPLNPGNSGGPLFNYDGEVVGVNTALFTVDGAGGSVGLGFSIPGNDARFLVDQLRDYGSLRLGFIGGRLQDVTPELAQALDLRAPLGVLVAAVRAGTPIADAGLLVGDVITRFGDRPVDYLRNLNRMVVTATIGSTVPVTVLRDGETVTAPVKIVQLIPTREQGPARPVFKAPARVDRMNIGLTVGPITEAARRKYRLDRDVVGVLITQVAPGSVGSDLGFAVGDVVQRIQNRPVASVKVIEEIVAEARKDGKPYVMTLVTSPKGPRWLAVPVAPVTAAAKGG